MVGFLAHEAESNTLYVLGLFWFFQAILEKNAPAAAQKNINLEILRGLVVPKPPIELQDEFAEVVEKIEALKSRYQQSLSGLEAFYGVLSQQAFKGELDLSRVPLPELPERKSNDMNTNHQPQTVVAAINLPETELLTSALSDPEKLKPLLQHWLEAYTAQLGDRAFSIEEFIQAAESRAVESQPDRDFELSTDAYDLIKDWVFVALNDGRLVQSYPSEDIRMALRRPPVASEG
mgnify:FL=1